MTPVRVLSVASEIYPIIKTGWLADVAGALPIALTAEGIEVRSPATRTISIGAPPEESVSLATTRSKRSMRISASSKV